jgi:hypothetical protein
MSRREGRPKDAAATGLSAPAWVDANQRFLAAEIALWRTRLAREPASTDAAGAAAEELEAARAALPAPAALDVIAETFGLSSFERTVLLLAAGAELDTELARALEVVAGRHAAGAGAPTFSFALGAVSSSAHWSALTPAGPLRRWRLVEPEPGASLTTAPLRVDERILHFLAGINLCDARLRALVTTRPAPGLTALDHDALADAIVGAWHRGDAPLPLVHLHGDDALGQEDVAAAAAARLGLGLLVLRAEDVPAAALEIDQLATLLAREAVLLPTAVFVRCGDTIPAAVDALVQVTEAPLLIGSRDAHRWRRAALAYDVRKPDAGEQTRLWREALGPAGENLNGAIESAAAQFRLSAQGIVLAAQVVDSKVAGGEALETAFWSACRSTGRRALDTLARRIEAGARWGDLVLPDAQVAVLKQIAVHVRQRVRV